jgi:hypothetical protein
LIELVEVLNDLADGAHYLKARFLRHLLVKYHECDRLLDVIDNPIEESFVSLVNRLLSVNAKNAFIFYLQLSHLVTNDCEV